MEVNTSAYCAWCKSPLDDDRKQQDQKLADKVQQIFTDNQNGQTLSKQHSGAKLTKAPRKQRFNRRCFYELPYPGCPSSLGDVKIGE